MASGRRPSAKDGRPAVKNPTVKNLVLVGGGHSHVAVIKRFGLEPHPGIRLTVIGRDIHTPYSGMLPGFIAGHYSFADTHIDLSALSRFAKARFHHSEVTGLDLAGKRVICANRPPVPYDVLSINTGSAPRVTDVPGAEGQVIPVKPINRFLEGWDALRAKAAAHDQPLTIAVVGAGAGGVEILLAIQHRLGQMRMRERGNVNARADANANAGADAGAVRFHLLDSAPTILPTHNARVQRAFARVLDARGVDLHLGQRVLEVGPGTLTTDAGTRIAAACILWVTAAGAPAWPGAAGLSVDANGFVETRDTLQTLSHPDVFAAGDIATMVNHPRPKSGVFAVRQGKPLADNLRRAILGQPLRPYRPQKRFLSLISTGNKYAVASRANWSVEGRAIWLWKDWIDRRFMRTYNDLPKMD